MTTDRECLESVSTQLASVQTQIATQLGTTPPPDPNPPDPPDPIPPGDYTPFELKLSAADVLRLAPGEIACSVLPDVTAAGGTTSSGQVIFGETTVSPRGATVEVCFSKTPGLIDPNAGAFYGTFPNTAFLKKDWLESPPPAWGENWQQTANAYGLPYCDKTQGPWYVNVRYNYAASECAYYPCGFVSQWNFSSF